MENKLNEEVLENVSGGTSAQTQEIKDFIRAHDPDFQVNNDNDVIRWLFYRSGLSWDAFSLAPQDPNIYVLYNNNRITHEELMAKLGERFPD